MERKRKTIKEKFSLKGIGIHSNQSSKINFHPQENNQGISFIKKSKNHLSRIPASIDYVSDTSLAVTLSNKDFSIRTVEHLLFAVSTCGITDLSIEIERGSEIPALDGSAKPFVDSLYASGMNSYDSVIHPYQIEQKIEAKKNGSFISIEPCATLKITCEIDFPHPILKNQNVELEYEQELFEKKVASARTFGFLGEIQKLHEKGFALGGSVNNALVFSQKSTLNQFRFPKEPVYHKILDIMSDLSLLGRPLQGHIKAYKSSHSLDIELAQKIKKFISMKYKNKFSYLF